MIISLNTRPLNPKLISTVSATYCLLMGVSRASTRGVLVAVAKASGCTLAPTQLGKALIGLNIVIRTLPCSELPRVLGNTIVHFVHYY